MSATGSTRAGASTAFPAYAVWSGLGTAVVAVIGYLWLGEQTSLLKAASLAMIVVGVVGLNLSGAH